ncbi:hypothetical protein BGZ94_009337 [Podila epigama]|nr:hypothetical protein BGZ94_009337 [Podila epigama]
MRSVPNTSIYAWYNKNAVLRTLNLRSVNQLLLLAIVYANDYSKNVSSLGLARNADIIQKIKSNTIEAMMEEYVEAASVQVGFPVDKNQCSLSKRVLHEMVDTPLPVVDRNSQDFLDRLQEFRGLISRWHEGELPFYVAPHCHTNQFRNYFTSKNTKLRSQKVVDLNTVKVHAPPPQKTTQSVPRPRKRQPSRKKTRQKYKTKSKGKEKAEQPYKRGLTLSTRRDHGLMKKHITKALTIGGINHAVYQTLLDKQPSDLEIQTRPRPLPQACDQCSAMHTSRSTLQPSKEQLADFLENLNFYYGLGTILLNGSLGAGSEYERLRNTPTRTVSTRHRSAAASAPQVIQVPHAVKAYNQYVAKTGFVPFNSRPSASVQAQPSTSARVTRQASGQKYNASSMRLPMRSVMNAIRGHYLGSKFPDQPDRDVPRLSLSQVGTGLVNLSESDLVHLMFTDPSTRPILLEALDVKTVTQADKLVVKKKRDFDRESVFFNTRSNQRLNGYSGKVSLQDDPRQTKFKLRGTICTDGLQLTLLAYDTSTTRRKRTDTGIEEEEDYDDDLQGIEDEFELEDEFLSEKEEEKRTATRRWRIRINQAKKFAQDTVIIGTDPGGRNTMTATRIDPHKSNERTSVTIRRSFLYRPYILFRRRLEARKKEKGIDEIESKLPTMGLHTMDQYLQYLSQSDNRAKLTAFYNDTWFQKKWDMKKAQMGAIDYGIKAILSLAEDHMGYEGVPKARHRRPVIFGIGLGSFGTQTAIVFMYEYNLILRSKVQIRWKRQSCIFRYGYNFKK